MSNEQNATPGRRSLLDQIHAVKEFAERWGYPDLAEWLTKHADEPCPAATAQFMEMDVAPPSEPPRSEAVREAIALIKRHDKCGRGQTGICRLEGEGRQCMTADDLRPVIFALADAERKLADERVRAEWIKPHMFMTGEPDSDVVEAARTAESLRHYADLLERDDALERAAAGALKLLHDVFDFTKRTPQVEATIANLSAVLAQRAKGRS